MTSETVRSAVTYQSFQYAEQMSAPVKEGSAEFVQISSGRFESGTIRTSLENLTIHETWSKTKTLHRAAANPDFIFFLLPLSWSGELRWNGRTIEAPTLIMEAGGKDYARRATDFGGIAFGVRREDFLGTVISLTGQPPHTAVLRSSVLADPT